MNYKNHLKAGYLEVIHKGKSVATSLNAPDFNQFIKDMNSAPARVGIIPPGYEHRADRIADLFYGSPNLDWVVCWSNNISDPFQQLNVGDRIRVLKFI
jgi:hypothetical protein